MSSENVEIAVQSEAAFDAGGVEAVLAWFTPDVVLHSIPDWVGGPEYRGQEGVRAMAAAWTDNFDEFGFSVSERRDLGDRVLTRGEMVGRIKGSGTPIRQPLMAVFSNFRDGQIGEVHYFTSWPQALEFVGLRD